MKKFYLLLTLLLVAFVGRATEVTWTKVTDASVLKAGYKVIIVCETKKVAMSTTQNENNRGKTDYTTIEDANLENSSIQIITLEDAGTTNGVKRFAFNTGNGYLYSASSSSNYLKTRKANNDDNGIWTISIDKSGNATIKSQGSNTRNTIKYNSSSTIFSSYSSGQTAVQLYYSPAQAATTCATPTFSVAGGTFYGNAGETLDVALSCTTEGATIKYTVNGKEQTNNGSNILKLVYPGTYEVVAWAIAKGRGNSASVTATYELVDVSSLTKFTKVTDASVLKAGVKVIFVNEDATQAMSTNQKTNNRGATKYTTDEGAILETGDIQVVTLEDAVTEKGVKGFAFNVGNGYLYSPSSSSNYLKTQTNNKDNENGIWSISVDEKGNASIISKGTNNIIQYNTSVLFSSYPQNKLQKSVQLYYSAANCADPTFSISEGTYYGFKAGETKEVKLSCETEGATIMYSINGENYKAYEAPITITCPSTTTISAYAMKADGSLGNSATVSKTYNYEVYPSVASIAEFKEKSAADAAADATKPYMFTCPLTVTYQNGNRLYLRDEAGDAILVYGAIDKAYTAGNQLPANTVVGTYTNYHQMAEIIPVKGVEWPTTETNADASPVEMTIDQLNAVTEAEWSTIASKLVVIKGAKVSADGSTITVGDASLANVYAKRFNPTLENASAVYDVVGIIETHWTNNIVDGIQFCQTAYLDNYSPAKLYMMGKIQSHNQDWNPTQGLVMEKKAAGIYSADVNLSFNDWFAITSRIAENNDNGGWAYINADRYAYTTGVFGKMATDYVMTKSSADTNKTQVFWTGNFKVTVDYYAKTISFVPAAVDGDGTPDYSTVFPEKLRIVGEIADGEWAGKSVVENHLATRGEDGYTYTFNELQFVKNGNFRFTTAWDATIWDGNDSDNKDNTNYTVNDRALKAATDAEPRINFNTVANILPFTSNDLVADVQDYLGNGYIFANLQLIVNLKDMTVKGMMYSGVSQIKVGGATVTATNGTIRVDGGNTTSIYNIAGQAIALGSQAKEFSVARGMYIVNVDGKATKVVVR